ncbi:MAG: methylated-DNA--[protein]-cysteine S-methyltransferase [Candidatus Bathyarchaeia archaeon]
MSIRYFTYSSPIGAVHVASTEKGLCSSALAGTEVEFTFALRKASGLDAVRDDLFFSELKDEFDAYFSGVKVEFTQPVDWLEGTVFQRSVWETMRKVPYGQTWSYKLLAHAIGREHAYRAVGQAAGRNPLPLIVPCHRVIGSNGKLGGFRYGLPMKRRLLELEHVKLNS